MLKLSTKNFLPSFFLGVHDELEHPDYPSHTHEFTEMVVIQEGSGINHVDGIGYPLSAGDVFVIHAGQKHSYSDTSHLRLYNVIFDDKEMNLGGIMDMCHLPGFHALFVLEPSLRKNNFNSRLHLQAEQLVKVRSILTDIERELTEQRPGFRLISKSLFFLLIGMLSRWYDHVSTENSVKMLRIAKSIAHMEQFFSENISVEQMAEIAHMSVRNFYRIFQQATGISPMHYLLNLRIAHAAELLKHSDCTITEIAYESGFQDSSYLTKQFKTQLGTTPSMFRKLNCPGG